MNTNPLGKAIRDYMSQVYNQSPKMVIEEILNLVDKHDPNGMIASIQYRYGIYDDLEIEYVEWIDAEKHNEHS